VPRQARENWYTRHFFPAPLPPLLRQLLVLVRTTAHRDLDCPPPPLPRARRDSEQWPSFVSPYRPSEAIPLLRASVPPCDIGRAGSFSCLDGGPLRCSCGMRRARLAGSLALVVSNSVSASVVVLVRAVGHRPVVCSPTDVAIVGSVPWIAACQFPAWLALIHRSSLCMRQAHRNINITSRRVYNIHFSTAHVCTHT